jgi:hypothetical protein
MYKVLIGAIIALGLAGATLATASTASAANIGISFNLGGVAIGYQDGYYDSGHHWHHWRNQNDARSYRTAHGNQYHDWKHDRDTGHGQHN